MAKKSSGWSDTLLNVLLVIPSIFNVISRFISCLEHDAWLAKRSIVRLVILIILSVMLVIGAWLSLCAIAFLWLQTWLSALASLSILFASHVFLLLIVAILLSKTKNQILFTNTRSLFHQCTHECSYHCDHQSLNP